MSIAKVYVCDQCKRQSGDFYALRGWTHIESANGGDVIITISAGRYDEDEASKNDNVYRGQAKPAGYYRGPALHFCDGECRADFFTSLLIRAENGESDD